MAGVKLNNNTATANTKRTKIQEFKTCRIFAKNYENEEQITEKLAKLWLEWNSTTTQKALNKANGDIKDVKTCRIFAISIRKRGIIHGKNGETVAGVRLDNNTASTKQSER